MGSLSLAELGECQEQFGLVILFCKEIGQGDIKRSGEGRRRVHVGTVHLLFVAVDPDTTVGFFASHGSPQGSL